MLKKKDRKIVCNLICKPARGTIWRVLRYQPLESKKTKKTQKYGRSHAPGFTSLSDGEEESSKVISLKNDKTIKGQ